MSVKYDFSGQLVLVTGSTAGIGRVIAEQYAASGASVIINSRKQENVDKTVKELTEKYLSKTEEKADNAENGKKLSNEQKFYGIAADLSKADECKKLVESIEKIGHLSILINNAGIFFSKSFFEVSDDEWQRMFNVNVMSTVRMCRSFLPKMLAIDEKTKKAKGGNIINISSEAGVRSLGIMIHYSMSKAAQLNISRGLAELTKGIENVRVNALLPGPTWTPGVQSFMEGFAKDNGYGENTDEAVKAYFKEHEPNSLKQKFMDPMEIAKACLYLSSNDASGINGSAFKVEGGIIKIAY